MEEEPNQFLKQLERKCLVDFYIHFFFCCKVRELQASAREEEKEVKVRQKKVITCEKQNLINS